MRSSHKSRAIQQMTQSEKTEIEISANKDAANNAELLLKLAG
jgi:hypothetical protein